MEYELNPVTKRREFKFILSGRYISRFMHKSMGAGEWGGDDDITKSILGNIMKAFF